MFSPKHRRSLNEAREGIVEAQQVKEDAIVAAYKAGGGMREIAAEVGMSHVGVSQLLERLGVHKPDRLP